MTSLTGMNVDEIRRSAEQFRTQARDLENTVRAIDRLVALAGQNWRGADVDHFTSQWNGSLKPTGLRAASDLRDLADVARKNAQAQQQTSSVLEGVGGAGPGGGLPPLGGPVPLPALPDLSWFGERAEEGLDWIQDKAHDGLDWVQDKTHDAADWVRQTRDDLSRDFHHFVDPRIQAALPGLERFGQASGVAGSQLTRLFTEGRIPQFSEVVASGILVLGTGGGLVANVIAGQDYKVLDPGKPGAGQPVPTVHVDQNNDPTHPAPQDFTSFTQATMDVYDHQGIRVTEVVGKDGVQRYVVLVPGTESGGIQDPKSWTENTNGHNWGANVWAVAQGSSATDARAVKMAMENAGIPPGSEVLFGAHSQGGIVASNLAADPAFRAQYNVQGVITYGAPVQCADYPRTGAPPALAIQHGASWSDPIIPGTPLRYPTNIGDPVARLDLAGSVAVPALTPPIPVPGLGVIPSTPVVLPGPPLPQPNVTNVSLPPRGTSFLDPVANHEQSGYIESLDSSHLSQQNQAAIQHYIEQNDLQDRFFTGDVTNDVRVQISGKG